VGRFGSNGEEFAVYRSVSQTSFYCGAPYRVSLFLPTPLSKIISTRGPVKAHFAATFSYNQETLFNPNL